MKNPSPTFLAVAPGIFVLIWATGFIVARAVAPHAEPLIFLTLRFALVALAFTVIAFAVKATWPSSPREIAHNLVAGMLLQGIYLAPTWWTIDQGLPAGVMALVGALQPLMVALLSRPLLGEPVGPRRALGIALGFVGVVLVLLPRLGTAGADGNFTWPVLLIAFAGIVSLTAGTFYQRRFVASVDLRTGGAVQNIGAAAVVLVAALALENGQIDFTAPAIWASLAWSVLILSIGGTTLLIMLIRTRAVAAASSLMYLVPPVSAAMAYVLFGETLTLVQIAGMAVAALGVALATRPG